MRKIATALLAPAEVAPVFIVDRNVSDLTGAIAGVQLAGGMNRQRQWRSPVDIIALVALVEVGTVLG